MAGREVRGRKAKSLQAKPINGRFAGTRRQLECVCARAQAQLATSGLDSRADGKATGLEQSRGY